MILKHGMIALSIEVLLELETWFFGLLRGISFGGSAARKRDELRNLVFSCLLGFSVKPEKLF